MIDKSNSSLLSLSISDDPMTSGASGHMRPHPDSNSHLPHTRHPAPVQQEIQRRMNNIMNPESHYMERIGEIIDKVMHPSSKYMKKIMEILGRHKKSTGECCIREKVFKKSFLCLQHEKY